LKYSFDRSQISENFGLKPAQERIGHIVLMVLLLALVVAPFSALWGAEFLWQETKANFVWVIVAFFASFYVHEGLHALGFMLFGGVPREAISIRAEWKNLDVQTFCGAPVSASAFRKAALLPALVLGIIPAIVSIVYGIGWLAFWSVLALNAVTYDLLCVWVIRSLDADDMVVLTADPSIPDSVRNGTSG